MGDPPDTDFYSPRELTYIVPAGRHLSDYEAVICHVQPGGETDARTRLQHPNWFQYRDPSGFWQRTYTREQAMNDRAVAGVLESASTGGGLEELDDYWTQEVLGRYHQGFAFVQWGLFRTLSRAVRHAPSDTLTMMLTFGAVDRLRHQQTIALFTLALEQAGGMVDEGQAREAWLRDPVYQPTRRVVERLMASADWCEAALVVGLLFEPLLSDFVEQHFFRRFGPRNGDPFTPVLAMTAGRDRDRFHNAMMSLAGMLLAETDSDRRPVPAGENRAVLQGYVDEWAPAILRAVDAFAPVYDLPTMRPGQASVSRSAVIAACRDNLARIGLRADWGE